VVAPRARFTWRRWDSAGDFTLIPGQQGNIDLTADGQMADLGTLGVKGDYVNLELIFHHKNLERIL